MAAVGQSGEEAGFVRANLRWNFVTLSVDYGLFGLGMTLASTWTVLAAFAERLGASNLVIGALPALQTVGWALPAVLAANYIERRARKLPLVLVVTVWERVPYLLMGIVALVLAESQPTAALALTLLLVATMAFSGGSIMPAWMDVIGKVIPLGVRGRFFATGTIISGLTGVAGAAVVGILLAQYPYPLGYALCFFAAFGALVASFFFLAATREYPAPPTKPPIGFRQYMRRLPGVLGGNHNFSAYLGARAFGLVSTMGQAFYTVFALTHLGAGDEQVGVFTFWVLAAETICTVGWGWLADRYGHKVVLILGTGAAVLGNAVALFATEPHHMYFAFATMGAYLSAIGVSHLAIMLEFSKPEDRPTYVGLGGTLLSPFSFAAPLIGGLLADRVGYPVVFATAAMLATASLVFLTFAVREPRKLAGSG